MRPMYRPLQWAALRTLSTLFATAAIAVVALASSPAASAGSRLIVGFGDHWLLEDPTAAVEVGRDLGATAWRVPLYWSPGQTELTPEDAATFDDALAAAFGMRVVVVVTGKFARRPPLTASARSSYCTYVRSFLKRYPTMNDIVVWNEPNKFANWQPQFTRAGASAAPAAYGLLLARCWDVLHAFRPKVNLLAPGTSPGGNDNPRAVSNVSHSPGNFLRKLGAAYRATGRTRPILDNVAHHMYGTTPAERPWRQHRTGAWIAQGDWGKLVGLLKRAFAHTRQPVPGRCTGGRCASIWYMEAGYQTTIDRSKRRLYRSAENVRRAVPDSAGGERATSPPADSRAPDQATQIVDGIRLAYCQPYVAAFFNYLLRDDADLRLWQSGAVWQDGTPKDSYLAFKRAIGEARGRKVNCAKLKGGPPPRG
jgi:hypothetical protein